MNKRFPVICKGVPVIETPTKGDVRRGVAGFRASVSTLGGIFGSLLTVSVRVIIKVASSCSSAEAQSTAQGRYA